MRFILASLLISLTAFSAEPEFPLTEDSKPQPSAPKGTLIKENYTAKEGSLFPGTQREYQIYLPAGFDKTKPAAFMVFQDGVIYQTPVVFDNLIAKKDIPPLVGIFIKPGVVPAANDKALPRFNRSYEYDSITPTYSQFLIDEFLPAIEKKHGIQLSTDPNHAAISGNSSGGICAFMVAWHRPDRFRRVFTGVGTYVGIHGADQLPVLVRKFEPKPLRVFLQSGTGDNNLYCGDWWMANQTMERSLTWAGYDVNHAWGEGGHNAKHASQIFPDVLRWLWRDWQTNIEIKANAKGESKWKGYEVVGAGEWSQLWSGDTFAEYLAANASGELFCSITSNTNNRVIKVDSRGNEKTIFQVKGEANTLGDYSPRGLGFSSNGCLHVSDGRYLHQINKDGTSSVVMDALMTGIVSFAFTSDDRIFCAGGGMHQLAWGKPDEPDKKLASIEPREIDSTLPESPERVVLSPDQTQIYVTDSWRRFVFVWQIASDGRLEKGQKYCHLELPDDATPYPHDFTQGMCVDTNGWLYVATSLGIQVCDQAGRVNFIIPTPKQPLDVCFGGKDLSELFIACGDSIYKRPTKAHGIVSGQMAPITPPKPKL
jgi:gluconolactonase